MRFRNIIEKKRLILTEWDNSVESKKNFKKAIKRLKNDNIEFIVVERRLITEFAKSGYFIYSVILDSLIVITFILALLNLDTLLTFIRG